MLKTSTMVAEPISIHIKHHRFAWILAFIALGLNLTGFGLHCYTYLIDPAFKPHYQLDLNGENGLPAYFSILLLFIAAILVWVIYFAKDRLQAPFRWHWLLLSLIFLYLSMDESISIHEKFNKITQKVSGNTTGIFYLAWVIPFGVLVLVFAVSYLQFWWRLPGRFRRLFAVSGLTYVGGALGVEIVEGLYMQQYGQDLFFQLLITLEETMEMLGIIVFIFALLDYIYTQLPELRLAKE